MLKKLIEEDLKKTLKLLGLKPIDLVLSVCENPKFGDYSSNIALRLSKQKSGNYYQTSASIANEIIKKFGHPYYLESIETAGPGFINFFIKTEILAHEISEIIYEKEFFGRSKKQSGKKVQVEFISANPTGPLTLANGRGGAIGDCLANVLESQGYEVEKEYYVNDTGNQVRILGESVLASADKSEKKDYHYQGEYIKELAVKFEDKLNLDPQELGHHLADYLLKNDIKPSVRKLKVKFDNFFSERSLYPLKIEQTLEILKNSGHTYEKDDALYFKSTTFGDDEDRVLMTSGQGRGRVEPTYFLSDIAYHLDVLKNRNFDLKINVWGADHHSYVKRMQGVLDSLGYKNKLKVILMQLVKLFREGKEVRMSKRAGIYVTLDELLEQVSPDTVRFFFLMYSQNTHINFDLDLAKEQSNKNPVYYVQYAYARMSGILNKVNTYKIEADLSLLKEEEERELIKHLLEFSDLVEMISKSLEVHKLTGYSIRLADLFHKFYEKSSVLYASNESLKQARISLVYAAKIVLGNTLDLLGIEAPERM